MENILITEFFKAKNRMDCDTLYEQKRELIKQNKDIYPLSFYLEAMHLYNMYIDAIDDENNTSDVEGYFYPYRLRKIIDLGNEGVVGRPTFSHLNKYYTFSGEIKIKELDGILEVLIKYANTKFLIRLMNSVFPILKSVPLLENIYVAIGIMKYKQLPVPPRIGQYFTEDYIKQCGEQEFYKKARTKIKRITLLEELPDKARAMFFQLPVLYKSLKESCIFDFGIISLQCYKIIEISLKSILDEGFREYTNQEIFDILPEDLKDKYKRDTFKLRFLEIGKIYYLIQNAFESVEPFQKQIQVIFKSKDILDTFLEFIEPKTIARYRNRPAHSEYMPQEQADEARVLLERFVSEALYKLHQDASNS